MRFMNVLRGEVSKTVTTPAIMLAFLAAGVFELLYCLADSGPDLGISTPETAGVYAFSNLSFFAVIPAVLIMSSEYVGGQITTSALAVPHRLQILATKLIISTVIVAIEAIVLAVFVATIYQHPLGDASVYATGKTSVLFNSLGLAVLSWVLLGFFSTCVATLIHAQTITMAGMIVLSFGGVPLMMAVKLFQYLPTNAGILMFISSEQTSGWLDPPDLHPTSAAAIVVAWCVVAFIAAIVALLRRDIGARHAMTA